MTSGRDKVQQRVNAIVAEPRVALDPALLGQDVVVLPLKVAENLVEADEEMSVSFGFRLQDVSGPLT